MGKEEKNIGSNNLLPNITGRILLLFLFSCVWLWVVLFFFLDEMQLQFTICLLNSCQSMEKIQPHSADSQSKGIHTILSCNIQNWISEALLASTLATFRKVLHVISQQHTPQELDFDRSLLCGQGTEQHCKSAKTHTGRKQMAVPKHVLQCRHLTKKKKK